MSVKHPLADAWTFYYEPDARSRARSKNWLDTLTKLPSFASVEDFWAIWSKLPRPSLLHDSSVYLFRSDRAPSWERWPKGGKWVVTGTGLDVDAAWESLCLAMLGEQRRRCQTPTSDAPTSIDISVSWTHVVCVQRRIPPHFFSASGITACPRTVHLVQIERRGSCFNCGHGMIRPHCVTLPTFQPVRYADLSARLPLVDISKLRL